MHPILSNLSTAGIIKPGESYLLCEEHDRRYDAGPLNFIYVIKTQEEIAAALDMEISICLTEFFEFKEYLGGKPLSADSYEFQFHCYNKGNKKDCTYSLYLQRIQTFAECHEGVTGPLTIDSV